MSERPRDRLDPDDPNRRPRGRPFPIAALELLRELRRAYVVRRMKATR